jgi:hypothetical protein
MNTYQSIEKLFAALEKNFEKEEAKVLTSKIINIAIYEIQDDGSIVSDSTLSEKILKYANDFEEVSRSSVA